MTSTSLSPSNDEEESKKEPIYKVGDEVRCKSDLGWKDILEVGSLYVVEELQNDLDDGVWYVKIKTPTGYCPWFYCSRFELPQSATGQWFSERLDKPQNKKKERVPDELDWEAHRAYMKGLR